VIRARTGATILVLGLALIFSAGAVARTPSAAQKAAIVSAFRHVQGDVAIQRVFLSAADPSYASMDWGFVNNGFSARNNSVLARSGSTWKIVWTREIEEPADGACVYVPAAVARDLLGVSCPPAAVLHARTATVSELAQMKRSFLHSKVTPYARNSTLSEACISKLDPRWAAAVSLSRVSGATTYVWFELGKKWHPVFESFAQLGSPPPHKVMLSLASCVGYNPADFNA
jgi:hypothetical protein